MILVDIWGQPTHVILGYRSGARGDLSRGVYVVLILALTFPPLGSLVARWLFFLLEVFACRASTVC